MADSDEPMPLTGRVRPEARRLSSIFDELAAKADGPVSLRSIRDALGDRSFATLLVFFAAINLLPLPPGSTAILGLPLVLVASQMVYGSATVWLPRAMLDRSLTSEQFRAAMVRVVPWLVWMERYIRPRHWPFWPKQGERIIGGIALLLSIIVTLPIPFGNWLPALAVALLGLSVFEKDGILLAIGAATALVSCAIVTLVVGSATWLTAYLWHHAGDWFSAH